MALQQSNDSSLLHAGEAVSPAKQGPVDAATQPDFIGADTLKSTGTATDLSAFLSGAAA